MKKYLFLALSLTACGSQQTIKPSAIEIIHEGSNAVAYDLTATADQNELHPATIQVSRAAALYMPKVLNTLANANYLGRATLTLGSQYCAYLSDGQGIYVRQDGSCNTFTPEMTVIVNPADTVSLGLEAGPESPVSVEAVVTGDLL